MKCPYCGSVCADDALYCPNCKQPLPSAHAGEKEAQPRREKRTPAQRAAFVALIVAFVTALAIGAYKLVGWIQNYQLTRLYTRGAYAPTLSTVRMDDLRQGQRTCCPRCGEAVIPKQMGRGFRHIRDKLKLIWYEKSAADPNAIVAYGA